MYAMDMSLFKFLNLQKCESNALSFLEIYSQPIYTLPPLELLYTIIS